MHTVRENRNVWPMTHSRIGSSFSFAMYVSFFCCGSLNSTNFTSIPQIYFYYCDYYSFLGHIAGIHSMRIGAFADKKSRRLNFYVSPFDTKRLHKNLLISRLIFWEQQQEQKQLNYATIIIIFIVYILTHKCRWGLFYSKSTYSSIVLLAVIIIIIWPWMSAVIIILWGFSVADGRRSTGDFRFSSVRYFFCDSGMLFIRNHFIYIPTINI